MIVPSRFWATSHIPIPKPTNTRPAIGTTRSWLIEIDIEVARKPRIPAIPPRRVVFLVPMRSATLPVIGRPTREPQARASRRKLRVPVPISSITLISGRRDSQEANRKPLVAKVTRFPLRAPSTSESLAPELFFMRFSVLDEGVHTPQLEELDNRGCYNNPRR